MAFEKDLPMFTDYIPDAKPWLWYEFIQHISGYSSALGTASTVLSSSNFSSDLCPLIKAPEGHRIEIYLAATIIQK